MLVHAVKHILKSLDDHRIPYAVIGGLAVSHHAVPRLTQDIDIIVFQENSATLRSLFPNCYRRGTAIVEVYEVENMRLDVLPARLRYQRAVVQNAVTGDIQGTPAKIAGVRDLILLKMFAAPNRPELDAQRADEADITSLIRINAETITFQDVRYIGDRLLELCFSLEEREKAENQIEWLNDTLNRLGMTDRTYPLPS
jgi:hypothetical protein